MPPHPPAHMENRNYPVVPLPNPGEGGPVAPVPGGSGGEPVIPLPNPGEGGPVYPGPTTSNRPNYPTRPGYPGRPGAPSRPGYPSARPDPGTGSGGGIQLLPGSAYPPVSKPYAAVRFLNATNGYAPFRIYIDDDLAVRLLSAGSSTGYLRVPSGRRRITVSGLDGYIYLQQSLRFAAASASTVAVVNRTGGLALRYIDDQCASC